jgi:SAM-dependent methyltransferase
MTDLLAKLRRGKQTLPVRDLRKSKTPLPCMHCGTSEAILVGTPTFADFDVTVIPERLREPFVAGIDGFCVRCGLYQNYVRYTAKELGEYLQVMTSKDMAVSEEPYHSFPVPEDFVADHDARAFGQRIERWESYFNETTPNIQRALFLRPMFGRTAMYIRDRFGAQLEGIEISDVSRRTTADRIPDFQFHEGNIHGLFSGPWLEREPYDAIFVFHTMTHTFDVHDALRKLRGLLRPGGLAIFSSEVGRKPWNPFHTLYLSEPQFVWLLQDHFDRVDRIDDCEAEPEGFTVEVTAKGDGPDFAAWVD